MATLKRWNKRDLERQFRQALFKRVVLHSPKVSPVVRQLPRTRNLIFTGKSKRLEEQESNLRRWIEALHVSGELERGFRQAIFEHRVQHWPKLSAAMREIQGGARASQAGGRKRKAEHDLLPEATNKDFLWLRHRGSRFDRSIQHLPEHKLARRRTKNGGQH
jgi:hypothetical protein